MLPLLTRGGSELLRRQVLGGVRAGGSLAVVDDPVHLVGVGPDVMSTRAGVTLPGLSRLLRLLSSAEDLPSHLTAPLWVVRNFGLDYYTILSLPVSMSTCNSSCYLAGCKSVDNLSNDIVKRALK